MLKLLNNCDILNLVCRKLAFKDTFKYYTSLWHDCQGLFLIGEKNIDAFTQSPLITRLSKGFE